MKSDGYVSGETLYVWDKRYYLEVCLGSKNSLEHFAPHPRNSKRCVSYRLSQQFSYCIFSQYIMHIDTLQITVFPTNDIACPNRIFDGQ